MKTRVGVIFGGRSGEHEVSILSAASVLMAIDREKYEAIPFLIDKPGVWLLLKNDLDGIAELSDSRISMLASNAEKITISDFDSMTDFAFPLIHGEYGEDGTIQGLFEMLSKPYAGCSVAASAVSMDKILAKDIWAKAGLRQCDYTYTTKYACTDGVSKEAARIESEIPYPIFVKPANAGSSIGISKVNDIPSLEAAIENAFRHDKRVIAERAVSGREIEIGLLGNGMPEFSGIGEIITENVYYDYDSKYRSSSTKLEIPADIPEDVQKEVEMLASKAYRALDGEGYARVDMFYDEKRREVYLNEMNTIPGFTRFSMFPLLWQEKGVGFSELIERIIKLGYERNNSSHNR